MSEQFANAGYGYACRIDNLKEAAQGNRVENGCEVTANGPADMFVDIASGEITIDKAVVSVGSVSDQAITAAHGSLDRYDIIYVGSNGTVDYTAGTAAANPFPPDLPDDHILLAIIFVENQTTTIETADIVDSRIFNSETSLKYLDSDLTQNDHTGDTAETTLASLTIPANTVSNGLIIMAHVWRYESNAAPVTCRLKVGPTSSEVTKLTVIPTTPSAGGTTAKGEHAPMMWYATGETWTNDVTVLLTGQLSDNADHVVLETIVITGW